MRKVLFIGILLYCCNISYAQSTMFKPFKVDLNLGFAAPQGSGTKGGVIFSLEPKYGVTNQIDIGLRLAIAGTARGVSDGNGGFTSATVKANASYLLTGDYFFTNTSARPFVGAGLGAFTFASATGDNNTSTVIPAATKFGELIRGGVEVGHLRLGIEYDFVPDQNGFFGATIGVKIGGGRIKNKM